MTFGALRVTFGTLRVTREGCSEFDRCAEPIFLPSPAFTHPFESLCQAGQVSLVYRLKTDRSGAPLGARKMKG
jgi:hypothetical protein